MKRPSVNGQNTTAYKKGVEAGKTASTPFLHLHDAVVQRAGRAILTVDDVALQEGESVALLGPNGSGKSTFVNLITREVMPLYRADPPVVFRGNPRATLTDIKRAVGSVSATMQREITVHLPAIDIVAGGLTGTLGLPHHVPKALADHARQTAGAALDLVGVAPIAERDIMTLSTGQARRVLIARALVHNPDILVFDEPCTGLDPAGMFYVRQSMRHLVACGKTIVLVTHYPEDVIPEIQRIILIKEGCVVADGSKENLFTSHVMSNLFDIPMVITCTDGYYSLVSAY